MRDGARLTAPYGNEVPAMVEVTPELRVNLGRAILISSASVKIHSMENCIRIFCATFNSVVDSDRMGD